MSVEDERDRLARRLAFYGILFGGVIGLGISFISIGGTLIISVVPQLHDAIIEAENNGTNLNKIQEQRINEKFNIILWEANNSTFYLVMGLLFIVLGIINSYLYIIRRRPLGILGIIHCYIIRRRSLRNHTYSQISSYPKDYTGKKYFDTRKRLAYHPTDKMFPNETTKPSDAKKEEPKKPRGTLPKGIH